MNKKKRDILEYNIWQRPVFKRNNFPLILIVFFFLSNLSKGCPKNRDYFRLLAEEVNIYHVKFKRLKISKVDYIIFVYIVVLTDCFVYVWLKIIDFLGKIKNLPLWNRNDILLHPHIMPAQYQLVQAVLMVISQLYCTVLDLYAGRQPISSKSPIQFSMVGVIIINFRPSRPWRFQ